MLLVFALTLFALLWASTMVLATWRTVGAKVDLAEPEPRSASFTPDISVLKPLCGADADLEKNLSSFFEQDHPSFELVFGIEGSYVRPCDASGHAGSGQVSLGHRQVADESRGSKQRGSKQALSTGNHPTQLDPAVLIVRRLMDRYPDVPARLIVHDGGRATNPKVSNLLSIEGFALGEVHVISDSNVRVQPDYLRRMQSELDKPGVGLATSLFRGADAQTLGAKLEALTLGTTIAGGVSALSRSGHPAVVGKSMMYRAEDLERLGGLAAVKNMLAEDYVIGRMFGAAGFQVRVASQVIDNVCPDTTLKSFARRHLRWAMIRCRLAPLAYAFEPLTWPLTLGLLLPLVGAPLLPSLAFAFVLSIVRDALLLQRMEGRLPSLTTLMLGPVRDAVLFGAWLRAPFERTVTWRGNKVRVSAGTQLYRMSHRHGSEPESLSIAA